MNCECHAVRRWVALAVGVLPVTAVAAAPAPEQAAVSSLVQLILGLVVVLVAIGVTVWLLRRFTRLQGSADGALRVLGGLSLGTRERVVLMQVGDTQLLVGIAPGRVQTLHVLEHNVQTGRGEGEPVFAQKLGALLRRERPGASTHSLRGEHEG